jgi:hypothetical protein
MLSALHAGAGVGAASSSNIFSFVILGILSFYFQVYNIREKELHDNMYTSI